MFGFRIMAKELEFIVYCKLDITLMLKILRYTPIVYISALWNLATRRTWVGDYPPFHPFPHSLLDINIER